MDAGSELAAVLSKAQTACPELADVQAADLQPGFGAAICTVLSALADTTLRLHPPSQPDHAADRHVLPEGPYVDSRQHDFWHLT